MWETENVINWSLFLPKCIAIIAHKIGWKNSKVVEYFLYFYTTCNYNEYQLFYLYLQINGIVNFFCSPLLCYTTQIGPRTRRQNKSSVLWLINCEKNPEKNLMKTKAILFVSQTGVFWSVVRFLWVNIKYCWVTHHQSGYFQLTCCHIARQLYIAPHKPRLLNDPFPHSTGSFIARQHLYKIIFDNRTW